MCYDAGVRQEDRHSDRSSFEGHPMPLGGRRKPSSSTVDRKYHGDEVQLGGGGWVSAAAGSDDPDAPARGTEQRLLSALLRDYDVDARGVDNVNKTVNVVVEFLLLRIQGLVGTLHWLLHGCMALYSQPINSRTFIGIREPNRVTVCLDNWTGSQIQYSTLPIQYLRLVFITTAAFQLAKIH